MPNIGAILKEEIMRLASRVSRKSDAPLKKDVIHLKHQVAGLKKIVAQLRRDNAQLLSDLKGRLAAPPAADKDALEGARLSPRLIHAQRKRLGLSREAFAKLVGVSAGAVMTWEGGRRCQIAGCKFDGTWTHLNQA
jgi:DNA-binding transcriptional regulator YiaG